MQNRLLVCISNYLVYLHKLWKDQSTLMSLQIMDLLRDFNCGWNMDITYSRYRVNNIAGIVENNIVRCR